MGPSKLEVIDPISLAVAGLQNEKSYSLKMNVFEWHFSRAFTEKKSLLIYDNWLMNY